MPRNSDEAPEWGDEDDYIDLTQVIERLEISEDLFDTEIYDNEDE